MMYANQMKPQLVGGFNPPEINISQIGSFPQIGVKIKKMKPPPSNYLTISLLCRFEILNCAKS